MRCEFTKNDGTQCKGGAERDHAYCGPHLRKMDSPKWDGRLEVLRYEGSNRFLNNLRRKAIKNPAWCPSYKDIYYMQKEGVTV